MAVIATGVGRAWCSQQLALKLRRAEKRFIPQSTRAVSFKRLLDRVANDLSDALILEPHRINDIICLLLPVRTKHLVCRESCSCKPSTRCRPLPCINHHKRRTLLRTPEAEGYRHSIVMAGSFSPFPEDEIEVRSVAGNLTELPLNEVRCETAPAFMDVSPHRAAGATATFTRAEVLLAARLYNETRRTHEQVTRSNVNWTYLSKITLQHFYVA